MQGEKQFRVKLILGHYFADHKANSYICVNRDWNTVQDLHLHIKNLFDIDGFVLKTAENIYLPDQENINVIERGDDLSAIPRDVAQNGAKISAVNKIHSINPFSQSKVNGEDPAHMDLNISGKWFKQPVGSDGDGLLIDVPRRKRIRKHKNKDKNRSESTEGDSSVSETPKIKSTKVVSVCGERKINGTHKPVVNKHVSKSSFKIENESDSDINVGASTSSHVFNDDQSQSNSPTKAISVHDTSTELEFDMGYLRDSNDLVDPLNPKKKKTPKITKTVKFNGMIRTEQLPELKEEYSDSSEYRQVNEGLSPSSSLSAQSVIYVEPDV